MTKNELIAFYKLRIKSINKIIDSLNELKKTNLTTRLVDLEIDIHMGELEIFSETLCYIIETKLVEITDEQREHFREELLKAQQESVNGKIDPEKVIKGEPVKIKHGGL
jgi:hypothetical protein